MLIPLVLSAALLAPAPPATVRVAECSVEESSAAFYARMRQVDASERMWMRFTLLEKQLGRYVAVKAPGLSRWRRSMAGVRAFRYRQAVRGLRRGAVYRMRVSFRWYSADGELVERRRRRSRACRQYVALPNLTSRLVRAERTTVPGVLRYVTEVSNRGDARAADIAVRLSVDGSVVDAASVSSLRPGEVHEVAIRGPECTSSVESIADPDGVIVESSEADNAHRVACGDL
ncbi:MAG: CARDB domain-containing protein [Thermoleophilaceae bacterium]